MKTYGITFNGNGDTLDVTCYSFNVDYSFVHFFDEFGERIASYNCRNIAFIVDRNHFPSSEKILASVAKAAMNTTEA